ncbi:MAG: hypothetical protein FJ135_05445 [Deltaproteobacteria bacterium]|nr:hypothetical protein [Deltaproteobacteria bacterium]
MLKTFYTIGFSTHRLESLPFARQEMQRHEAIVLEESPSPTLAAVLQGEAEVEEYLWELDAEFPEFSRCQLEILKDLRQQGKTILQVEPYLEQLVAIHELFAQEISPEEVMTRDDLREVYQMERATSAALLGFYQLAWQAPFGQVVESVKHFARRDAARFRLRDAMRAQALAVLAGRYESVYVEAGHMHLALPGELHRQLNGQGRVKSLFLLEETARKRSPHPRVFGPGDILTFRHLFQRPLTLAQETLLAAQSLIYIKLLSKDEIPVGESATPHLDEELRLSELTRRLTYADCERLYPRLRRASPVQALTEVERLLPPRESSRQS